MLRGSNGEGYCPCGASKLATCNRCGRHLCGWHYADGVFSDEDGGVETAPVCWPRCTSEWWADIATKGPREWRPGENDRGHATQQEPER